MQSQNLDYVTPANVDPASATSDQQLYEDREALHAEAQQRGAARIAGSATSPARAGHSTAAVGHLLGTKNTVALLVYGGFDGADVCSDLFLFANGSWRCRNAEGTPPAPRAMHAACMMGDHLMVMGGWGGGQVLRADTCMLDVPHLIWKSTPLTLAEGPTSRQGHSMVAVESSAECMKASELYLFGGETLDTVTAELWWLRPVVGPKGELNIEWKHLTSAGTAPEPRSGHCACMLTRGHMIVFGGRSECGFALADLHVLSLSEMRWSTPEVRGDVLQPRWAAACCLLPEGSPNGSPRWLLDGGRNNRGWVDEQFLVDVRSQGGHIVLCCNAVGGQGETSLDAPDGEHPCLSGHTVTAHTAIGAYLVGGSRECGELSDQTRLVQLELVRWVRPEVGLDGYKRQPTAQHKGELFDELTGPPLLASTFTATRCGQYVYLLGGFHSPRGVLKRSGGGLQLSILHLPSLSWELFRKLDGQAPKVRCGHSAVLLPHGGGICLFGGVRSNFDIGSCVGKRLSDDCYVLKLELRDGEYAPMMHENPGEPPVYGLEWDGKPLNWVKQGGPHHASQHGWPTARAGHSATSLPAPYVWDQDNNSSEGAMLVMGGYGVDAYHPHAAEGLLTMDVALMRPTDASWLGLQPSGTPPTGRSLHSATLLNEGHLHGHDFTRGRSALRVAVFGGWGLEADAAPWKHLMSANYLNDLHLLTLDPSIGGKCDWVTLRTAGSLPVPRCAAALIPSRDGGVLLLGGHTWEGPVSDPDMDVIGLSAQAVHAAEVAGREDTLKDAPIAALGSSCTPTPAPDTSPVPFSEQVRPCQKSLASADHDVPERQHCQQTAAKREDTHNSQGAHASTPVLTTSRARLVAIAGSVYGGDAGWTTDLMAKSCRAFRDASAGDSKSQHLQWARPSNAGDPPPAAARMAAFALDDHVVVLIPPPPSKKKGICLNGANDEPGASIFILVGDGGDPAALQGRFTRRRTRGAGHPQLSSEPSTTDDVLVPPVALAELVEASAGLPARTADAPSKQRGGECLRDAYAASKGPRTSTSTIVRASASMGTSPADGLALPANGPLRRRNNGAAPPHRSVARGRGIDPRDRHGGGGGGAAAAAARPADGFFHCSSSLATEAYRDTPVGQYSLSQHHLRNRGKAPPTTKPSRSTVVNRLSMTEVRSFTRPTFDPEELSASPDPSFGTTGHTERAPFDIQSNGESLSATERHLNELHLEAAAVTATLAKMPPRSSSPPLASIQPLLANASFASKSPRIELVHHGDVPAPDYYAPRVALPPWMRVQGDPLAKDTFERSVQSAATFVRTAQRLVPFERATQRRVPFERAAQRSIPQSKPDRMEDKLTSLSDDIGDPIEKGDSISTPSALAQLGADFRDVETLGPDLRPPPFFALRGRVAGTVPPDSPGPAYLPRTTRDGGEFVVPAGEHSSLAREWRLPAASYRPRIGSTLAVANESRQPASSSASPSCQRIAAAVQSVTIAVAPPLPESPAPCSLVATAAATKGDPRTWKDGGSPLWPPVSVCAEAVGSPRMTHASRLMPCETLAESSPRLSMRFVQQTEQQLRAHTQHSPQQEQEPCDRAPSSSPVIPPTPPLPYRLTRAPKESEEEKEVETPLGEVWGMRLFRAERVKAAFEEPSLENLQMSFNEIDYDRSGKISKRELYGMLKEAGLVERRGTSNKRTLEVFQAVDADDEGQLDFEEFAKAARTISGHLSMPSTSPPVQLAPHTPIRASVKARTDCRPASRSDQSNDSAQSNDTSCRIRAPLRQSLPSQFSKMSNSSRECIPGPSTTVDTCRVASSLDATPRSSTPGCAIGSGGRAVRFTARASLLVSHERILDIPPPSADAAAISRAHALAVALSLRSSPASLLQTTCHSRMPSSRRPQAVARNLTRPMSQPTAPLIDWHPEPLVPWAGPKAETFDGMNLRGALQRPASISGARELSTRSSA